MVEIPSKNILYLTIMSTYLLYIVWTVALMTGFSLSLMTSWRWVEVYLPLARCW